MRCPRPSNLLAFEDHPTDWAVSDGQALRMEMLQSHFFQEGRSLDAPDSVPHKSISLVYMEGPSARAHPRPSEKKMHIEKEANQAAPLCPEYSKHEQGYLTSEKGGGQTESTLLPMLKLMVITEQKNLHPASLKATQISLVCENTEYGMFSPFP